MIDDIHSSIRGTAGIDQMKENHLTYLSSEKFIKFVKADKGMHILTTDEIYKKIKSIAGNNYYIVENPVVEFARFHNNHHGHKTNMQMVVNTARDPNAIFHNSLVLGQGSKIMAGCVIGENVFIGKNTQIFPNVVIGDNVVIGNNCRIHSGVVIGSDGFRLIADGNGNKIQLRHIGSVWIGNNVRIGANTCIDRGTFTNTVIENNVNLDNLVHVAHNVIIRKNVQIVAHTTIGGSTEIKENTYVSMGVLIKDNLIIGRNANINMAAVVTQEVKDEETISGFYGVPSEIWNKHFKTNVLQRSK